MVETESKIYGVSAAAAALVVALICCSIDGPVVNGPIMVISYHISFIGKLFRGNPLLCKEQPLTCNNRQKLFPAFLVVHHSTP